MSEEETKQRIRKASKIFSLAKSLYQQLLQLEHSKFDSCRQMFDFLDLIQTSLYSTIILNLSHLLKNGERHSIIKLLNLSVNHCELPRKYAEELQSSLQSSEAEIDFLIKNRDKRIAHFELKGMNSLNDELINHLMQLTESLLKDLNIKVLERDHSFDLSINRSMGNCMEILFAEYERIIQVK